MEWNGMREAAGVAQANTYAYHHTNQRIETSRPEQAGMRVTWHAAFYIWAVAAFPNRLCLSSCRSNPSSLSGMLDADIIYIFIFLFGFRL